jgi:hypothetical protein
LPAVVEEEYRDACTVREVAPAGCRGGWTVVSVKNDWSTVFAAVGA